MLSKKAKKVLKRMYKKAHPTRENDFGWSLREADRVMTEDGEEGWTEYGFYALDSSMTNDEISEWFEENVVVRIWSDYDCTGKPFTAWLHWHRNPCGLVSFVHYLSIDC